MSPQNKRPKGKERAGAQPWAGYSPVELTPGGRVPFPTAAEPVTQEEPKKQREVNPANKTNPPVKPKIKWWLWRSHWEQHL